MPFDFNEFLTLAEELATKGDEAAKRSSMSRAYYTVYHLANTRAEDKVGTWKRRKEPTRLPKHRELATHAWCWCQYIDTNDIECRKIGVEGDRMKRRRVVADYVKADIQNIDGEVKNQLDAARQMRSDLTALDRAFPRPT